jgi:dienelactone hydrolase
MSAGRLVPVVGSVGFALLLAACGGGGDSAAGPTQPAGSLSVGSCTIVEGATTCSATVSWTTMNATSPRVLFGSTTLATTASGSATIPIGAGTQAVTLLDGATQLDSRSVVGTCIAASAWDGTACRVFAVRTVERAPTSFVESGRTVTLEVVIYKPLRPGPHPAVMFNHGSTGNGDDPAQFRITYTNEAIARFFADRGWLVAFPQRRGRGASDGLYDEGFTPDRSRYSCLAVPALAGFERALLDVDAAAEYLAAHDDVDATRMLSAGTSRGGVLAVVHAAERPDLFDGAVNFVGGWLGQGCQDSVAVNRPTFARGGTFRGATIWLYGDNDTFYDLAHSRANFDAFIAAGGTGSFRIYTRAPSLNGHFIVNDPSLWTDDLDTFVRSIGGG